MLETVVPVQFHDAVTSGRTKPSRLTCEKSDGTTVEVVAKFSAGCDRKETSLAMEVIGACLAADLGLPVPQPYLLDAQPAWVATVTHPERKRMMELSNPTAFGSTQVSKGWRAWTSVDKISAAMLPTAVAIFAFDAFISNPDRRDLNPNCLVKGGDLRIFDHELAFFNKAIIGWKPPWKAGALASLATPGNHIFHAELKGRTFDLVPIETAWTSLSDGRLAEYKSAVPASWLPAAEAGVGDALDLIRDVRDNIRAALEEVKRVLT